jgi:hypothetical protein
MPNLGSIRVGKPDTTADKSAHTSGVREGNRPGTFESEPGHVATGEQGSGRPTGKATARRSTSINPADRDPIDPRMPNLPPA